MTSIHRIAILVATLVAIYGFASAEGGGHGEGASSESGAPLAPPQPRVVEPLRKPVLPPREADSSWQMYQEGLRLYGDKRLGESLDILKKAVESRSELFSRCAIDVDAAAETKEAKKAKDSLSELLKLLAARDLIPQDFETIRAKAAGSVVAEMRLLRETSPSSPLRGLIDAALLVVEARGMARIGDSLSALRRELLFLQSYPEAEYMIGKAYLAEGELRLAELQFRRACDMKESLELPEERYAMLASLADVYKAKGDLKGYESILREIADASDLFANKTDYYRNSMERTLGERGIDKFMAMFKIDERFPIGAYQALGELYLADGRTIATVYLAAAANAILARELSEIRIDEPGYAYAGLGDLLSRIKAEGAMARYAAETDLWKGLKLLGDSLAASGYRDSAKEIWSALVAAGAPQPWGKRAAESLARRVSASAGF
jgi:hypothetical protein